MLQGRQQLPLLAVLLLLLLLLSLVDAERIVVTLNEYNACEVGAAVFSSDAVCGSVAKCYGRRLIVDVGGCEDIASVPQVRRRRTLLEFNESSSNQSNTAADNASVIDNYALTDTVTVNLTDNSDVNYTESSSTPSTMSPSAYEAWIYSLIPAENVASVEMDPVLVGTDIVLVPGNEIANETLLVETPAPFNLADEQPTVAAAALDEMPAPFNLADEQQNTAASQPEGNNNATFALDETPAPFDLADEQSSPAAQPDANNNATIALIETPAPFDLTPPASSSASPSSSSSSSSSASSTSSSNHSYQLDETVPEFTPEPSQETVSGSMVAADETSLATAQQQEEAAAVTPQTTTPNYEWNLDMVNAYELWQNLSSHGENYTVAVLDSGIAFASIAAYENRIVHGYDFVSSTEGNFSDDGDGRDADYYDTGDACTNWHGSFVTSVLAANYSDYEGVAPSSKIIPVRVLGKCKTGYASDVADGIVWAAGGSIIGIESAPKRADIIVMAFAGLGSCPSYIQTAVDLAIANNVTLYAAAGNDPLANASAHFPANCRGVVSVGALNWRKQVASYSSKNADVYMPGGDSTKGVPCLGADLLATETCVGTSMAVPHAAGLQAITGIAAASLYVAAAEEVATSTTDLTVQGQIGRAVNGRLAYPPCALAAYNTTLSACSYGNGVYTVAYSSIYDATNRPTWFLFDGTTSGTVLYVGDGAHWAANNYATATGLYTGTSFLVSGYTGDWFTVKLPYAIALESISIYARTALQEKAPGNYRLYGSNDAGVSWLLLMDVTSASYTSLVHNSSCTTINCYSSKYSTFGMTVNKLQGTGANANQLNFMELELYTSLYEDGTQYSRWFADGTANDLSNKMQFTAVGSGTWSSNSGPFPGTASALVTASYMFAPASIPVPNPVDIRDRSTTTSMWIKRQCTASPCGASDANVNMAIWSQATYGCTLTGYSLNWYIIAASSLQVDRCGMPMLYPVDAKLAANQQWMHIAMTINNMGSATSDDFVFYLNGVVLGSSSMNEAPTNTWGPLIKLSVGTTNALGARLFDARYFYTKTLTQTEIKRQMCYNGYYWISDVAMNGACAMCPAGTYSTIVGAADVTECQQCAAGTYSASTGASSASTCVACAAAGYSTASSGSTNASQCVWFTASAAAGLTQSAMPADGSVVLKFNDTAASSTFSVFGAGRYADILIVGGGGGGGGMFGGGGGAGGVVYQERVLLAAGTYAVTVGAGAAEQALGVSSVGATGSLSKIVLGSSTLVLPNAVSCEGKGGGGGGTATSNGQTCTSPGISGGSGGGGAYYWSAGTCAGGASTQGNTVNGAAGGYTGSSSTAAGMGGGGGGAGAAFSVASAAGGSGIQLSITGSALWYAAGGGSGNGNCAARSAGGSGIGGTGVCQSNTVANTCTRTNFSGVVSTGSGGGGGGWNYAGSGADNCMGGGGGGSGVVIVRLYPCANGYSYDVSASASCVQCQAGTYAVAGSTVCTACAAGTYSISTGSSSCTACPSGFTTQYNGSTSAAQCGIYSDGTRYSRWFADGTANDLSNKIPLTFVSGTWVQNEGPFPNTSSVLNPQYSYIPGTLPSPNPLDMRDRNITISTWMKRECTSNPCPTTDASRMIIDFEQSNVVSSCTNRRFYWYLLTYQSKAYSAYDSPCYVMGESASDERINVNQAWMHLAIAIVNRGNGVNDDYYFWINGKLAGTNPWLATNDYAPSSAWAQLVKLYIGMRSDYTATSPLFRLYDMRYYYEQFLNTSSIKRQMCYNGYYWIADTTTGGKCTACPAGTFSNLSGAADATECQLCPDGYTSLSGSIACTACAAGTYECGNVAVCSASSYPYSSSLLLAEMYTLIPSKTNADLQYQLGPIGSNYTYSVGTTSFRNLSNISLGLSFVSNGSNAVNGYTIPRGYQVWVVPRTGVYQFVAAGAQGASYSATDRGGYGATMSTTVTLQKGDVIILVVGIQPLGDAGGGVGGGGGGTFVTKYAATGTISTASQHTVIAVAGGGGGVGYVADNSIKTGMAASFSTSGTIARAGTGAVATAGGGGGGCGNAGGNGVTSPVGCDTFGAGSGGGGFLQTGANSVVGALATQRTTGGNSFLSGGAGGYGIGTDTTYPEGGFGCAGGSWNGGGGGGGYSGGQGAAGKAGGGGGSYDINGVSNAATAYTAALWNVTKFGPARSDASGYNAGDGYILISFQDACMRCTNDLACVPCSQGQFSASGSSTCSNCASSTFSNATGSSVCTTCSAATYTLAQGSPYCQSCALSTASATEWYQFNEDPRSNAVLLDSVSTTASFSTDTANLEMWYKFDGSRANMLLDSSGKGRNIVTSTGTFDALNGAMGSGGGSINYVKASTQYTTLPSINVYNIQVASGITFSLWFKATANNVQYGRVFEFSDGTTANFICIQRGTVSYSWEFVRLTAATGDVGLSVTLDASWQHVVWTISTAGIWTIYINGTNRSVAATNRPIPFTTAGTMWLGYSAFGSAYTFDGNVDDFRVYNRVLTASEVASLYGYAALTGTATMANMAAVPSTSFFETTTNLLGWYRFDAGALTTNTVPNGATTYNLVDTGTVALEAADVRAGTGAAKFSGANYYSITTNNAAPYFAPAEMTLSFWVRVKSSATHQTVASSVLSGSVQGWMLYIYPSPTTFGLSYSNAGAAWKNVQSTTAVTSVFSWYHVTATLKSGDAKMYINGILEGTSVETYANTVGATGVFYVGSDAGAANKLQSGSLVDDLRIYNRILSTSEISALYSYNTLTKTTGYIFSGDTNGLQVWYTFDSDDLKLKNSAPAISTAYDLVNTGTTFDATNKQVGSGSLALGVGLYATIPTTFNPYNIWSSSGSGMTVAFWFRASATGSNARIFEFNNAASTSTAPTIYFTMFLTSAGGISACISNNNVQSFVIVQVSTSNYLTSTFYHVAWTVAYSAATGASATGATSTFYINGINQNVAYDKYIPSGTTWTYAWIGRSGFSTDGYITGNVDDFRVYSRVLSSAEVSALYSYGTQNKTVSNYYPYANAYSWATDSATDTSTNLLGWFKMDSGSSITVNSGVGGSAYNLTSIGSAVTSETADYKVGTGSASFSGSNYYSIANAAQYFAPAEMTLSLWCKVKTSTTSHQDIVDAHLQGGYQGWIMYLLQTSNVFSFQYASTGGAWVPASGVTVATATLTWYHIAATLKSGEAKIYVNGILEGTATGTYSNSIGATSTFLVGAGFGGSAYLQSGSLVDDLRIYNRVISAQEVLALYNLDPQRRALSPADNVYLAYQGPTQNIQSLLNSFHVGLGFSLHFVFRTSSLTSTSQLLYIGNYFGGDLVRVFVTNNVLTFEVANVMSNSSIASANAWYVVDMVWSYVPSTNAMTLSTYYNNFTQVSSFTSQYNNNLLLNADLLNLNFYIGRAPSDLINDATPATIQDLRLYPYPVTYGSAGFKHPTIKVNSVTQNATLISGTSDYYFAFTDAAATSTITFQQDTFCDVLIIGGGGAGGVTTITIWENGGGGAGGLIYQTGLVLSGAFNVTVGAGGTTGNGMNSVLTNGATVYNAVGGGKGGDGGGTAAGSGGSGGGGASYAGVGGAATPNQGYSGGAGGAGNTGGGGGGGAGAAGGLGSSQGEGGVGLSISITGSITFYAGGGAGSLNGQARIGGNGGGGNSSSSGKGVDGTDGKGGGGGASMNSALRSKGGSGIVILRYRAAQLSPYTLSGTVGTAIAPTCSVNATLTCAAGSFLNASVSSCQFCPINTFSNVTSSSTSCTPCSPGTYAPSLTGNLACIACPAGTYATGVQGEWCLPCPPGTSSAAGAAQCTACGPGFFSYSA